MTQKDTNRFGNREAAAAEEEGTGDGDFYTAAVTNARKGRYREALESLSQALDRDECSEAEALDLQARIFVQQGRLLDAESCWMKAQAIDGSNTAYADALARLRRGARPVSRIFPLAAGAAAITLIGALAVYGALDARKTAQQIERRYSELRQAQAAASAAGADVNARLEARIVELDKNMKLLATADEMRTAADSLRTEIERAGAALKSVQASLADPNAVCRQEAEMVRSRLDSLLAQVRSGAAALQCSQSNPEP